MQLKKLFIALAGLGLSASAFALTPLAVNGFNNPNSCTNWIFGVAGDYLQPLGNDLDYANLVSQKYSNPYTVGAVTSTTTAINEEAIDPDYDWGWQGMIDYRFPQTTNDIELSYSHFNASNDDHVASGPTTAAGSNHFDGQAVYTAGTSTPFAAVKGEIDNKFDQVNLDFGHTFNDGRLGIRVDGGLQWARIASDMEVAGAGDWNTTDLTPENISGLYQSNSVFRGLGPTASLGANFDLGNGLSVYADGRVVLLVGDIEADSNSTYGCIPTPSSYCQNDFSNKATFSGEDQLTVVPGGDAEAGLSYTAPLGNNVGLTVQAGYMVAGYVHPVRRVWVDPGSVQGSSTSHESTLSDFGLQGPYIGLDLSF